MNFIIMHKNDPHTEAGEKPPMSLVAEMGAFIGEFASTGRLLGGAGLPGSHTRTRLTFRGGQCTIKQGPYKGEHELPSEILEIKTASRDAAVGWAERYGKILVDGELELGPVNEPWDIGLAPRPENPPLRFLMIVKADRTSEAGEPRSPEKKAAISRLRTEMTKAGVLTSGERLEPSSKAKRLVFDNHQMRAIDGPFAESKELIGGFAILRLETMEEAVTTCQRYAKILGGTLEIDIRVVADSV